MLRHVDRDLADVDPLPHQAERIFDTGSWQHAGWQRWQLFVGVEQVVQQREPRGGVLLQDLREVDRVVGHVVSERVEPDLSVFVEVSFAQFEEPAVRRNAGETADHRLTGQRVQNNIDAASVGRLLKLIEEVETAGVHHPVGGELGNVRPFRLAAGGRVDVSPDRTSNVQGGGPYAAGS